jgi:hypothetical protein
MSDKLIKYLASLNSTETQLGIYVDPENIDEFACSQYRPEGWVCIGSPDSLNFGFVPTDEVIDSHLMGVDSIEYKGKKVRFNRKGLISAYSEGRLDEEFQNWLMEEIEPTREDIALSEAEIFVSNRLPEIIEQYQSDLALAE